MASQSLLDYALQYAARGWPVFPVNGFKMPYAGTHGFKDATTSPAVIEAMWAAHPYANIGLATGELIVIDPDGAGSMERLRAAAARYGGLPKTLTAKTTRGFHLYYRAPPPAAGEAPLKGYNEPRTERGAPGIDIKAAGGYVLLPPSLNRKSGKRYEWANAEPIADAPAWLVAWLRKKHGPKRSAASVRQAGLELGQPPEWAICDDADGILKVLIESERPEIKAALAMIPADCGYDMWFEIGAAIHDFDPGPRGLAIFRAWSLKATKYQDDVEAGSCELKWLEYQKPKPGRALITKDSIYYHARRHTTLEAVENANKSDATRESTLTPPSTDNLVAVDPPPAGETNGHHSAEAVLPDFLTQDAAGSPAGRRVIWVDVTEDGEPRPTTTNAGLAIGYLGIRCAKDAFHEKLTVGGQIIDQWAGALTDEVVLMLRKAIKRAYDFDPGDNNCRSAAVQLCLENQFNPVVDYLEALRWDGVRRVGKLAADYLGAADTPLNSEIGRLMLVAAVRRARQPGTKFDQIVVLEGREGTMKSTAIKILAGEDNFSDQNVLAVSDKEQQEALTGVWIHEIAELAGMRRAEVERVKQFASRTEDRARPAWGRFRVDHKRTSILVATTNDKTYLQSDTGNRRFWPIETGRIEAERLSQDRDQLWAEAAMQEARGDTLVLDRKFWSDASAEQERRRVVDPWENKLLTCLDGKDETSVSDLLELAFQMQLRDVGQSESNRIARILHKMNFERYRAPAKKDETRPWRYRKIGTLGLTGT